MKIKRYFAADIRQAMRMVREAQGPDAVILSNRRVKGGVEIVAAVDYDETAATGGSANKITSIFPEREAAPAVTAPTEPQPIRPREPAGTRAAAAPVSSRNVTVEPSLGDMQQELKDLRRLLEAQVSGLAWGQLGRQHPLHARLVRRLMELGFTADLCRDVVSAIPDGDPFEEAWRKCLGLLAHKVRTTEDDILSGGSVVALVGATGVGKTTTIAKLAARYALRHGSKRVALITTDNYRVGAHEQLRTFGGILGVPVRVASNRDELIDAVHSLADRGLVLIDTAGMSQRDIRLSEQLSMLQHDQSFVRTYLVMAATAQTKSLDEAVQAFRGTGLSGCILTKLDETASIGGALSVIMRHNLSMAYTSDGQRVPEDIQQARVHSLISRCVAMRQDHGAAIEEEAIELEFGRMAASAHV